MRFGFHRYDGVHFPDFIFGRHVSSSGCELFRFWPVDKRNIVLICRNEQFVPGFGCAFYQFEKRCVFFHSVDYERAVEYLVAAMLGVDL